VGSPRRGRPSGFSRNGNDRLGGVVGIELKGLGRMDGNMMQGSLRGGCEMAGYAFVAGSARAAGERDVRRRRIA
jgi:hypothetical protein